MKQSDGVCSCQCVDGLTGPDCTELDTSPGGSSVCPFFFFLGFVIEANLWFWSGRPVKTSTGYLNRKKMDLLIVITTLKAMNLN